MANADNFHVIFPGWIGCAEWSPKASWWKLTWIEWPFFLQTLLCALLANKLLQKCILKWDKLGESLFYWNLSLLIFTQGRRAIANITQVDFPFAWLPHVTNGGKGHLPAYLIHCPLWGSPAMLNWPDTLLLFLLMEQCINSPSSLIKWGPWPS